MRFDAIKAGSVFLVAMLVACSGPMVQTRHDRKVPFAKLKTYAWHLSANQVESKQPVDATLDTRIRSAVDAEMLTRGVDLAPEKDADLLLNYHASVKEEVDASYLKNYNTAEMMGLTTTLGQLVLTMRRGEAVAWEGTVQISLDTPKSGEERAEQLRQAIAKLLAKFPPR